MRRDFFFIIIIIFFYDFRISDDFHKPVHLLKCKPFKWVTE